MDIVLLFLVLKCLCNAFLLDKHLAYLHSMPICLIFLNQMQRHLFVAEESKQFWANVATKMQTIKSVLNSHKKKKQTRTCTFGFLVTPDCFP